MDELNKNTHSFLFPIDHDNMTSVFFSMTPHGCVRLTALYTTIVAPSGEGSYETKLSPLFRNGISSAFKIIGAIGAECRAKGGALFHIIFFIFYSFYNIYSFHFGRYKSAKLSRPLQCLNRWIRPS